APGGVHPLLDVHGQGEEVQVLLGLLGRGRRRQHHRVVVEVGHGGAGGLAGQPARLEADPAGAERAVVDDGLGALRTVDTYGFSHGKPPKGSISVLAAVSRWLHTLPVFDRSIRIEISPMRRRTDPEATTEARPAPAAPARLVSSFLGPRGLAAAAAGAPGGRPDRPRRINEGSGPRGPLPHRLAAQAETLDQLPVAVDVLVGEVLQEPATTADQQQEAAAAVVVVLVLLQVLGQIVDAARQQRDLDLRRSGVTLTGRVLGNDLVLGGGVERHVAPSMKSSPADPGPGGRAGPHGAC